MAACCERPEGHAGDCSHLEGVEWMPGDPCPTCSGTNTWLHPFPGSLPEPADPENAKFCGDCMEQVELP